MNKETPPAWKRVALADLMESDALIQYGILQPGPHIPGGVPYVRPTEIVGNSIQVDRLLRTTEEIASGYTRSSLRGGDVILSIVGTIGKVAIVPDSLSGGNVTQSSARLRPNQSLITTEMLAMFLRSPLAVEQFNRARLGTGVPRLNIGDIRRFEVPLPPLAEQKRIVAKLEELTARSRRAKEALDAVPPLLDQLRQSILAAAFRGDLTADWRAKNPDVEPAERLLARVREERRARWEAVQLARMTAKGTRPTDDRWKSKYRPPERIDQSTLDDLPRGWRWASWEEIGTSQNGRPFPSSEYQASGVRLLRPGNLHVSGAVHWTLENTRRLPEHFGAENQDLLVGPGELIMNLTAQSLKDAFLGRVCLTSDSEPSLLNQRLARLTPILMPPRLIMWMFKSPQIRSYIDELNSGSLIQHMFTSQVDGFALPIPPLDEQTELLRLLDSAFAALEAVAAELQQSVTTQTNLDAAILAKGFRGELVPQDHTEESAADLLKRIRSSADTPATASRSSGRRARQVAARDDSDGDRIENHERGRPAMRRVRDDTTILEIDTDTLHDEVFSALWLLGCVSQGEAVRRVAAELRAAGRIHFDDLHPNTPLHTQLLAAIDSAVAANHLDRPLPNHVRAIKPDPTSYTPDDWQHILLTTLPTTRTDRGTAIRTAAEYARDNLGLRFSRLRSDGHIVEALRSAITTAIRRGDVLRHGSTHISRVADDRRAESTK